MGRQKAMEETQACAVTPSQEKASVCATTSFSTLNHDASTWCGLQGLGCRNYGLGVRVQGLGFGVQFRVQNLGSMQGSGFGFNSGYIIWGLIQGSGFGLNSGFRILDQHGAREGVSGWVAVSGNHDVSGTRDIKEGRGDRGVARDALARHESFLLRVPREHSGVRFEGGVHARHWHLICRVEGLDLGLRV